MKVKSKSSDFKYPSLFRDWALDDFHWPDYFKTKNQFLRRLTDDLKMTSSRTLEVYYSYPSASEDQQKALVKKCQSWQRRHFPDSVNKAANK
jgi:hypothetical protein